MKKASAYILILLFLSFSGLPAFSQSWNHDFFFHNVYASYPKEDNFAKLFNQLAYNNNVSVLSLHLDLSYQAQLSLTASKTGIPLLRYKVKLTGIRGDTRFRDFNVDTLLIPEKVKVLIQVYQNHQLIDSLDQVFFINRQQVLIPVSEKVPLSSLYITVQILRPVFTNNNYKHFIRTAKEINHYYGYVEIFKALPQLIPLNTGIHPAPSTVFLNYMALTRLMANVRAHHFPEILHLKQKDPLHFQRAFAPLLRKQIRMHTLSQQIFNGKNPADSMDRIRFARLYAGLSMKAVALSKQHQPYIAASFNEFSRVYPDKKEKGFVETVSHYYSNSNKPRQGSLEQYIYKDFVNAASLYVREKDFVRALDFLSNAAYFERQFSGIKRPPEFDTLLVHSRDGLATSFLKVAAIASHEGDKKLTQKYISQALESLQSHHETIPAPPKKLCYVNTAKRFTGFAREAARHQHFSPALKRLAHAQQACPSFPPADTLKKQVCLQWMNQRLTKTNDLLQENQTAKAYNTLLFVKQKFFSVCHLEGNSTIQNEFSGTAVLIYNELLLKSNRLLKQKDIRQVIKNLAMASRLQKDFSLPHTSLMDSLTQRAAIPYILSLTDEARLEIWKTRFQQADSLFYLARQLSRAYNVDKKTDVLKAFNALARELRTSNCRWKQEEIALLFNQTRHAVQAYKMRQAHDYFQKAKQMVAKAASCPLNKTRIDSVLDTYENMFRFTDEYHRLTLQLFNKGFAAVLPGFVRLEKQYNTEHLEQFNLPFTNLYTFVRKQHSEVLITQAVQYFIRQKEFATALHYLQLSENPAKAKAEQKQIATGFAQNGLTPDNRLLQNPAFAYFAKTWHKQKDN